MVSEFRKKKLIFVFNFFDSDKSGSMEKKDFELAFQKTAKVRGWSANDANYKLAETTFMKIWDEIQSGADTDKDGKVTQDEWLSMWDSYAKNPSAPTEWQKLYCKLFFDIADASSDGAIDSEEFSAVCVSYGLDKNEAVAAFNKMAKGKSTISWDAYQELWKEYFSSEDVNAPGNCIFGKTSS